MFTEVLIMGSKLTDNDNDNTAGSQTYKNPLTSGSDELPGATWCGVWVDSGRRLLCNLMFSDSFYAEALILKSSPVRWIPNDGGFIQQSCHRHSFIWHQHNWQVRLQSHFYWLKALKSSQLSDWWIKTISLVWLLYGFISLSEEVKLK